MDTLRLDSLPAQQAVPQSRLAKRNSNNKTPSKNPKTPGKSNTPGKPKTPKTPGGDRFIPNRSTTNFQLSSFLLQERSLSNEGLSPMKQENQKIINDHFNIDPNTKILSFRDRAPQPIESIDKSLQGATIGSSSVKSSTKRHIPSNSERILDAPEIRNDYYLNILDWSCSNLMAVSLNSHVYVWNATTGGIERLMSLDEGDYVGSVSWMEEADYLAVGTSDGIVQLWDANTSRLIRKMDGHNSRIPSLSWNKYIISSGSRGGQINHYDVRSRNHQVCSTNAHTQEVCGLKWSCNKQYLASGGNDNNLLIWEAQGGQCFTQNSPLQTLSLHQAAVKALAWCPWREHVLASGGGTADKTIRLWNVTTGDCLHSTDTNSQVCGLLWSSQYREIISGHGYAKNHLSIWKYPSMSPLVELLGHSQRILALAMSPDGQTVVSAGADETLRLWKCFAVDPKKARKNEPQLSSKVMMDFTKIR